MGVSLDFENNLWEIADKLRGNIESTCRTNSRW